MVGCEISKPLLPSLLLHQVDALPPDREAPIPPPISHLLLLLLVVQLDHPDQLAGHLRQLDLLLLRYVPNVDAGHRVDVDWRGRPVVATNLNFVLLLLLHLLASLSMQVGELIVVLELARGAKVDARCVVVL